LYQCVQITKSNFANGNLLKKRTRKKPSRWKWRLEIFGGEAISKVESNFE